MGHPTPFHQWDMHRRSLFIFTPSWAREDSISLRALPKPPLLHIKARWDKAWVEARGHKPGL